MMAFMKRVTFNFLFIWIPAANLIAGMTINYFSAKKA
jgi:hypothetical protein